MGEYPLKYSSRRRLYTKISYGAPQLIQYSVPSYLARPLHLSHINDHVYWVGIYEL